MDTRRSLAGEACVAASSGDNEGVSDSSGERLADMWDLNWKGQWAVRRKKAEATYKTFCIGEFGCNTASPFSVMATVRTPAEVAHAEAVLAATLSGIPTVDITVEQAKQLKKCTTLQGVHQVLGAGVPWNLAAPAKKVADKLGSTSVLHMACGPGVHPDVMAYFLGLPAMCCPAVLERVAAGVVHEAGVPPEAPLDIGRGITPLLACIMNMEAHGANEAWQLAKCEALLGAGACLAARSRTGASVLQFVVRYGSDDVIRWAVAKWKATFPGIDVATVRHSLDALTFESYLADTGFDEAFIQELFHSS